MKEKLEELRQRALSELATREGKEALNEWRVQFLGKKGELTAILRGMGQLSPEERPVIGQFVNEVRSQLEEAFAEKENLVKKEERERKLREQAVDVTLPGRKLPFGHEHPLMRTIREMEDIFIGLGFEIAEGPVVELDYYNFEALNLPKNHPARDMQDTFYVTDEILLRTHTSPVQVRTMEKKKGDVPLRIVCPGRVFRRDDDDATHSHEFTQLEGLVVDRNIRMSDLKGILLAFAKQMFGQDREIRLRPSYFPFTEPSAEVDLSCGSCGGSGCRVCKHTGWIEILGAGMVHPRVLEMAGYDPEIYRGFAFGMGIERIAMMKYGVDDIRQFYVNDVRFIHQFKTWS
ncbi:phenylalanine--tRNA ligase alpha subunit [Collibacillus ludicampi]|jgi:phenylalanyl-tRNA synthetase alpha chain|uniref:Phenylalanine--tRNA ligase alpha subunit n=1 Tax=Collibacillus ludicampi TaxID=2771369 RepID=A0AAV4LHC2_9BACL|nr:phenylalanine--tRNA ligase subunit alpha [Collibacillus ludicampi]GIM47175.1 phenylalanine--tRNA ligase alpha subunit [Collibacillus ludicampi]